MICMRVAYIRIRKKYKETENCGEIPICDAGNFAAFFFMLSFAALNQPRLTGEV